MTAVRTISSASWREMSLWRWPGARQFFKMVRGFAFSCDSLQGQHVDAIRGGCRPARIVVRIGEPVPAVGSQERSALLERLVVKASPRPPPDTS